MSKLLRVPFALDENNQLLNPANAEKGKIYFCPVCNEPVIYRHGEKEKRVAHFAHKVSGSCNQETITHKTAKLLIQKAVDDWKSGKGETPIIERACQGCGKTMPQQLPEKVDKALLEYRLENGFIVDVALMVKDKPQAAIEIWVTHAVDRIKASNLSVPFIELDGYGVIENPMVWQPMVDNFKPLLCNECKSIYLKFQAKATQVAKACNLVLPNSYYRHGICKCWKCKREIIVFAWVKDVMHDNSAPKIQPPPRTVQYRFSKTVGDKYWVNSCPYCQSIQGDFFLYCEPDGAFFGVNCTEDSVTAFESDMFRIASHAKRLGYL